MADNELSRVESFQYPAGHIGHLSGNQAIALDGFKRLCEREGYYKPADADGRQQASHDDETLLYVQHSSTERLPSVLKDGIDVTSERGSSTKETHSNNSRTPRTGAATTSWTSSTKPSTLGNMKKREDW